MNIGSDSSHTNSKPYHISWNKRKHKGCKPYKDK
jgi:hypothetical protein